MLKDTEGADILCVAGEKDSSTLRSQEEKNNRSPETERG